MNSKLITQGAFARFEVFAKHEVFASKYTLMLDTFRLIGKSTAVDTSIQAVRVWISYGTSSLRPDRAVLFSRMGYRLESEMLREC